MTNYKPSSELSRRDRIKRNMKSNDNLRKWRQKKKQEENRQEAENNQLNESTETSGYESASSSRLQVRMNFPNRKRNASRVRISRALSKAHRKIKDLKSKNDDLTKKNKTLQKRVERMKKKTETDSPRSSANKLIKEAGLSKRQGKKVRKQLILGNAVLAEVKETYKEIKEKRNGRVATLGSIVSGKIIKKYRGNNWLSSQTGITRKSLTSGTTKWKVSTCHARKRARKMYAREVQEFLERDDNSRCQPGKADSKISENERKQTRVLTDYMGNLYEKFAAENPTVKLSKATFCRMRPNHVLITRFISRSTCLCTKHQNMALLLRALRKGGVPVSANPEAYATGEDLLAEELQTKLPDRIVYGQWKRVEVTEKEKKKSVTRIVETDMEKNEFIKMFEEQTKEFRGHVERVHKQYEEVKKLKENLPPNQIMVQMDFAENYSCKSVEEIQSAYWNQTGVTLHPVVVYFRNPEGVLQHRSFVVVSDEMSHSSNTVHAIIEKIMPELKLLSPDLEFIHYWTDGPTSQYRNKQIFYTIANHKDLYGVSARWNYFEVGHGKGPCDGLGGTTKRMADEAVRCGKAVIQDANDFFKWASESNMRGVSFVFVSADDCNLMQEVLKPRQLKPLKGTFKLHVVAGMGNSTVCVKDVSCYCQVCLDGGVCDEGWRRECLQKGTSTNEDATKGPVTNEDVTEDIAMENTARNEQSQTEKVNKDDYVAARYSGKWYVGRVVSVDDADEEVEISFLENKKEKFQWPANTDIIWVPFADIICVIKEPVSKGRRGRMLEIDPTDRDKIETLFAM
ncbi:hypothetical protein FSP39_015174 [Pinctada imbricata]|uniref:Uncharacterized protein n=1 Tax=Pinctada imbricata TaxID=66713 RepID=A0AA89CAW2_PINIB|nr:hypothetical protein FSP39_015174 [Pinctada imbricata]